MDAPTSSVATDAGADKVDYKKQRGLHEQTGG